jgi:hypothetical protein
VKAQKNDDRDAEAIAEASTRPTMRFVELKSQEQLDMQTLHRARDRLVDADLFSRSLESDRSSIRNWSRSSKCSRT